MSTEYYFMCHKCRKEINLGSIHDAAERLRYVLAIHEHHAFNLGEDSDMHCATEFNYASIWNFVKYMQTNSCSVPDTIGDYSNIADFIGFFNAHRINDNFSPELVCPDLHLPKNMYASKLDMQRVAAVYTEAKIDLFTIPLMEGLSKVDRNYFEYIGSVLKKNCTEKIYTYFTSSASVYDLMDIDKELNKIIVETFKSMPGFMPKK